MRKRNIVINIYFMISKYSTLNESHGDQGYFTNSDSPQYIRPIASWIFYIQRFFIGYKAYSVMDTLDIEITHVYIYI